MAGISIQTKNASYYGAINNSKKSAMGKVGAFTGSYAKKTATSVKTIAIQKVSTKKSQGVQSNKKQLLEDLEKPRSSKINLSDLSDKEAADLKAAQIAAEKEANDAAEKMEANKAEKKKIVFVGTSVNKQNGYLDLTKTKEKKAENKAKKKLHYSYKDVSSKIQRAKTSVSAGQAVISAKRKVLELRRKASSGNIDSEDLQLALSHAKKMETIAKRKKHNLEMEEMIEQVKEQDERADKMKEGSGDTQNDVIEAAKGAVEEAQDEILEQRDRYTEEFSAETKRMMEEYEEEYSDDELTELSEAMSEEMAQMIEEFGQDEMEMLEETFDMLEQLEVVNPHMSDEKFEDLKRKHRASEDKALMKANMEYLKGMMKQLEKESESHKSSAAAVAPQACAYSPATISNPIITISVPTGVSIDEGV